LDSSEDAKRHLNDLKYNSIYIIMVQVKKTILAITWHLHFLIKTPFPSPLQIEFFWRQLQITQQSKHAYGRGNIPSGSYLLLYRSSRLSIRSSKDSWRKNLSSGAMSLILPFVLNLMRMSFMIWITGKMPILCSITS